MDEGVLEGPFEGACKIKRRGDEDGCGKKWSSGKVVGKVNYLLRLWKACGGGLWRTFDG